jgi:hypothetical protein
LCRWMSHHRPISNTRRPHSHLQSIAPPSRPSSGGDRPRIDHAAAHAIVAVRMGETQTQGGCPRFADAGAEPLELEALRRDLAVLMAGPVADLIRSRRITRVGVGDLVEAFQRSFDSFMYGSFWPEPPSPVALKAWPTSDIVAMTVVNRAFVETERAVATAARVLLATPKPIGGTDQVA